MFRQWLKSSFRLPLVVLIIALLVLPHPAQAFFGSLTVEKEKELGEEFSLQLQQYYPLVQDPFLVSYLNTVGQKLVRNLGPQPFRYRFFILDDPTFNAFAVPGGYIFINSGLIRIMEREDELAGVLAHEITHVNQRHLAKRLEKAKFANIAALIGGIAAVLLGGSAAAPILAGTVAGAETAMLKYSRDDEHEADTLGFKWLTAAGYDPRYMISVFKKMARQRWFEGGDIPVYLKTHPELESRMVDLAHLLASHQVPAQDRPPDPAFTFFRQRLEALTGNPTRLKRELLIRLSQEPENVPHRYCLALVYKKLGEREKALESFKKALELDSGNDLIRRDLAVYYYENNRFPEAEALLRDLLRRQPQDEVAMFYLGLILQARQRLEEALPLFERIRSQNPAFTEVYYNLGTIYGEQHRLGLAHYYLGLHSRMAKDWPTALFHFRTALKHLSTTDKYYPEALAEVARLERLRVRVSP